MAFEMEIDQELIEQAIKDIALLEPRSLDSPIGDGDDLTFADFIPGVGEEEMAAGVVAIERRESLEMVLDTLSPREAQIIRLRFGLVDGHCRTLEEVAQKFDLTRERIRQIEAQALRRLRHPRRVRVLRDLL